MASSRTFTTSPLMFESDDEDITSFDENAKNIIKDGEEKHAESSVPVVDEPKKEERLLKRFQNVLMGIPPPPAFTVPQLDVREILMLWRDNQKYRVVLSPGKVGRKDEVGEMENKVKSAKWPEALRIDNWDIYYNRSAACEEMERLSLRYKDRYVGAETSSCVNALFAKSPSRTASARKRARTRAWGHSPGRRLSHLARRRKAFSYCSVAGNNNPDKKMIMVEIKKMSNRQKKRNSSKKTKPTPKKKSQSELNTYKRALFQSPDQLPAATETLTPNTQCIQRSKRNLFIETSSEKINENGKRERKAVRKVSPRKRVNRSLSFQDNTPLPKDQREPVPAQSGQAINTILSGAHKQKMLWAVTNALRDEAMGMSHELFRPCMSVLFKACQKLWLTKEARLAQEGSTSENMLALAKQFTTYTIKQISQDPTAEHMAMVCRNVIKIAESQSKSEDSTLMSGKNIVDENVRDELKSVKSSPIRLHESCDLPVSGVEKVCLFKEDIVTSTSTDSTINTNSSKQAIQNSAEKGILNRDLPSTLKLPDLRIVLTPLGKIKGCKVASNHKDTKEDLSSSSSQSPLEVKPLCRVSKSHSDEFPEDLSTTAQSVVNKIEQSTAVCHEGHEEQSKMEESNTKLTDSNEIYTPSKTVGKTKKLHKDFTNASGRVTRRKSNEVMALNVTLGDVAIQRSEPTVETVMGSEITSPTTNKKLRKRKDETNTAVQSPYLSPRLFKKSSFNDRRKSNSKENTLYVSEAEPLSLSTPSLEYMEGNPMVTSSVSQESILLMKVPENALITNVCTENSESDSCISSPKNNQLLKSITCKPYTRTLRSNSKDSPVKSITLNQEDPLYCHLNSNVDCENKTDKSKPNSKPSLLIASAELSPQKSNFIESKCVETTESPGFFGFDETELSASQECTDSSLYRRPDGEKNKENIEKTVVSGCYSERKFDIDNTCHNPVKKLPVLTAYTHTVPVVNRTLQLYKFSKSGSKDIEPPLLMPHWEHQPKQQETTLCADSPPPLVPHREHPNCSSSSSLPECIMAHWQQMSSHVSASDKIMFDFEDTSYEITFSPTNEDSTASSICAPFEFPHLIDESKSGFNTINKNNSTDFCEL